MSDAVSPPPHAPRRTEALIADCLAAVRSQLGMDLAFLGELLDDREVFRGLDGDAASFGLEVGGSIPRAGSYCERMIDGRIGEVVSDSAAEPEVRGLDVTRDAGIGAYAGVPIRLADGRIYGALCGLSHDADHDLPSRDRRFMRLIAEIIARQIEHDEAEAAREQRRLTSVAAESLLAALATRDPGTGTHSEAVVRMSRAVARRLGLTEVGVAVVAQAARLHDVGKIGVPDRILGKAGPLDAEEWTVMKTHPTIGAELVGATPGLEHLRSIVAADHERWDGEGYPNGLCGEEIPIEARIVFACDAFDAMVSDRPYRRAMGIAAACEELERCAGTQFDAEVVAALLAELGHGARETRAALVVAPPVAGS